jgi:methionyl-tRNA synthetase
MKNKEKIFIGVAWPYVNGEMHIGHLAGYLLPADILARFFRLKNHKVLMASGSDCFGTPVLFEAFKKKIKPSELANRYHGKLKELFKFLNLSFDVYTETDNSLHKKTAQDFFLKIYKEGYISRKVLKQYYSEKDKMFLPDRFVEGICKYCSYEEARSDQCDNCGRILEPGEIIGPRNRLTNSSVALKETEHYFLNWPKLQPFLRRYVKGKGDSWKKWVNSEAKGWLKVGLLPRAITRDITWGVRIPIKDIPAKERIKNWEKKSIYVWFEAVVGYLSASIEFKGKDWKDFWYGKSLKHYYFMGKDNLVFHTLFWPGQLSVYDSKLHLPDIVSVNHFLNLEGKKFSKSRGVMITCDYLAKKYGLDETRFYLCWIMPETKDSSFTWSDFQEQINSILVGKIGNLIHRSLTLARSKKFKAFSKVKIEERIIKEAERTFKLVDENISSCKFRAYLQAVADLADYGNRYFDSERPWAIRSEKEFDSVIVNLVYLIGALGILLKPLLPNASERLRKDLGFSKVEHIEDSKQLHRYLLKNLPKVKIKKTKPLFKKISEDQIKLEKNG